MEARGPETRSDGRARQQSDGAQPREHETQLKTEERRQLANNVSLNKRASQNSLALALLAVSTSVVTSSELLRDCGRWGRLPSWAWSPPGAGLVLHSRVSVFWSGL